MRVINLKIENFRGVKSADLTFDRHTLLVGGNNVGKSTICEALDLVLSPDRLSRFPPVQEFDFYNASYLDADGTIPVKIRIEVMLVDLSGEVERTCAAHTELWHVKEQRFSPDTPCCEYVKMNYLAHNNARYSEMNALILRLNRQPPPVR